VNIMRFLPGTILLFTALACSKPPPPLPECTGDTPLVEGIPGSPGHLVASTLNPNGMSELALLMRDMVADMEAARDAIERGGQPAPVGARYRKLRCSWPTQESMRKAPFDALAVAYLARVAEFDQQGLDAAARYTGVLKGCRACHEVTCGGPLAVIDGLELRPQRAR